MVDQACLARPRLYRTERHDVGVAAPKYNDPRLVRNAGARTSLIGALGGDEHSQMIRSVLGGASVYTSHVRGVDGPPGTEDDPR